MRAVGIVLWLAAIGCGRFGFDARSASDAAAGSDALAAPPAWAQGQASACSMCASTVVTLTSNVIAHDMLVAAVFTCVPGEPGCGTTTVADSLNTTWLGNFEIGVPMNGSVHLWYTCDAAPGAELVTFSNGNANYGISAQVIEISGGSPQCVDAMGVATDTGASVSVTTSTAIHATNDLLVAFFGDFAGATPSVYTAGAGFTMEGLAASGRDSTALEVSTGLLATTPQTAVVTKTNATDMTQAVIVAIAPHG